MVSRMQREVDLRFAGSPHSNHRGISGRDISVLNGHDLNIHDDGRAAFGRFRVVGGVGKAMARSVIVHPSRAADSLRGPPKNRDLRGRDPSRGCMRLQRTGRNTAYKD